MFNDSLYGIDTDLVPETAALYGRLGVKKEPLSLIPPQFEAPLPQLQPAVFPPMLRELPPPPLDLVRFQFFVHTYAGINVKKDAIFVNIELDNKRCERISVGTDTVKPYCQNGLSCLYLTASHCHCLLHIQTRGQSHLPHSHHGHSTALRVSLPHSHPPNSCSLTMVSTLQVPYSALPGLQTTIPSHLHIPPPHRHLTPTAVRPRRALCERKVPPCRTCKQMHRR
jgi:hypothetical protein